MKNIFIALALLVGVQLHAAIVTVKFVDGHGRDPEKQNYDQRCRLVNCSDNTVITNNTVTLALGDVLKLQLPRTTSYATRSYYAVNNGDPVDVSNLSVVRASGTGVQDNCFVNISFDAIAAGTEELDIHFKRKVSWTIVPNASVSGLEHLLGHMTIVVAGEGE